MSNLQKKRAFKKALFFIYFDEVYFTPCISFFNKGVKLIIKRPAMIGTKVKIKKKVLIEYFVVISSIIPPIKPANLFPIPTAIYHRPNIIAIIFPGTSLET